MLTHRGHVPRSSGSVQGTRVCWLPPRTGKRKQAHGPRECRWQRTSLLKVRRVGLSEGPSPSWVVSVAALSCCVCDQQGKGRRGRLSERRLSLLSTHQLGEAEVRACRPAEGQEHGAASPCSCAPAAPTCTWEGLGDTPPHTHTQGWA